MNPFANNPHYKPKGQKVRIPIRSEQEIITQEINKVEVTIDEPKKRRKRKRIIIDES